MSQVGEHKFHKDFAIGLGWMYSTACALADKGKDIRKVEVPDLISDAERDCARCENPRTNNVETSLPRSTDHQVWAKEFNETAQSLGYPEMDEEWLSVWFANAICAGRDAESRTKSAEIERLRAENERLRSALVRDDEIIASMQGGA